MSLFDKEKPKKSEKLRYSYRAGDWDVWIISSPYKIRLAYPTHRLYGRHPKTESVPIPWTYELLLSALQGSQRQFAAAYGGKWDLVILDVEPNTYPLDRPVGAREKNEVIMLDKNYPNTAGKRFLQGLKHGDSYNQGVAGLMAMPKQADVKAPDRVEPPTEAERADDNCRWEH